MGATSAGFPVYVAVRVVQGAGQAGIAGFDLGDSLAVRVEDPVGTPRAAAPVQWTASDGTVSATDGVSDAAGTARVSWRVALGAQTLTASSGGRLQQGAADLTSRLRG